MSQQEDISDPESSIEKIREELAYHMGKINLMVDKLNSLLTSLNMVQAISFQIPQYSFGAESAQTDFLPVSTLHDNETLNAATETFKKFYCVNGKSRKAVYRHPGIIVVNSHNVDLKATVDDINNHKLKFKASVLNLGESQKLRHDIVHDLFPMLNTQQVYRRINYIDAMQSPIVKASFSWTTRASITKTNKEEVLKKLDSQKSKTPNNASQDQWASWIEIEKDEIKRLPDNIELRFKRPTKIFPIVNFKNATGKTLQQQTAMPMIIFQNDPITIRHLPDYIKRSRARRSDVQISDTPIIERLSLFCLSDT